MSRLQSQQACDLTQFISLMHRTLKAAWGNDWGTFCEAFPNGRDPQQTKLPVITYQVISKRPGIVSKDGTRELKPRLRDTVRLAATDTSPADVVSIYAQWFDHDIVFELWEETNTALTQLGERFEEFMMTYSGYFKSRGVGEIIFDKMLNGYTSKSWRDNLVPKSYFYYVRLEQHVAVPSNVIKEIIGRVEIHETLTDDSDQKIESINFES